MKRFFVWMLCLLTAFFLFACTAFSPDEEEGSGSGEETDAAPVSVEEALTLASDYWWLRNGITYEGVETHHLIIHVENAAFTSHAYRIVRLSWQMNGTETLLTQELLVDPSNGEIKIPTQSCVVSFDAHNVVFKTNDGYTYLVLDAEKTVLQTANARQIPTFSFNKTGLYDVCIDLGEGNLQHQYFEFSTGKFTQTYDYVVAESRGLIAYLKGPLDARVLVIQDLFDQSKFYQEYHPAFAEMSMPIIEASLPSVTSSLADAFRFSYHTDEGTERSTQIPILKDPPSYFSDYSTILDLAYTICNRILPDYDPSLNYSQALGVTTKKRVEWCDRIISSLHDFYPAEDGSLENMGYAVKDLDRNGSVELILLRDDFEVIAIFAWDGNLPFLADHFSDQRRCMIGENGYFYITEYSGDTVVQRSVSRISKTREGLEEVVRFGVDGDDYCKVLDGVKSSISETEYKALTKEHWGMLEGNTPFDYMRNVVGLRFATLESQHRGWEIVVHYENYENVLADATPMSEAELLRLREDPVIAMYRGLLDSYRISCKENYDSILSFTLVDIGQNGTWELLLRTYDQIYVIRYEDVEKMQLSNVSTLEWNCVVLENGTYFTCAYDCIDRTTKVYLRSLEWGRPNISYGRDIGTGSAFYYCGGTLSREEWLADLRSRKLKKAYWYDFNEENIQTYLPCQEPLPFTDLTYDTYDSLLKGIACLTRLYPSIRYVPDLDEQLAFLFDCSTQENYEKFLALKQVVYGIYPDLYSSTDAIGYAFWDLEKDGIKELLLFDGKNYELGAVYTLVNGVPTYKGKSFGFQLPDTRRLEYWEKQIGMDILPLMPLSTRFDLISYGK